MEDVERLRTELGQHATALARHDAELGHLRETTAQLRDAIAGVRGEVQEARREVREELRAGFGRMGDTVDKVREEALQSFSPQSAREFASAKATRAVALCLAGVAFAGGIIAAAIAIWHH